MVVKPVIAFALLLSLLAQTVSYGYQVAGEIQKLNIANLSQSARRSLFRCDA